MHQSNTVATGDSERNSPEAPKLLYPGAVAVDNGVETGWERFLERLRRLWPKRRDGEPLPA
jgi:hypothetical protein